MPYVVLCTEGEARDGTKLLVRRFVKESHTDDLPSGYVRKDFPGVIPDLNTVVWDETKAIFVPRG